MLKNRATTRANVSFFTQSPVTEGQAIRKFSLAPPQPDRILNRIMVY